MISSECKNVEGGSRWSVEESGNALHIKLLNWLFLLQDNSTMNRRLGRLSAKGCVKRGRHFMCLGFFVAVGAYFLSKENKISAGIVGGVGVLMVVLGFLFVCYGERLKRNSTTTEEQWQHKTCYCCVLEEMSLGKQWAQLKSGAPVYHIKGRAHSIDFVFSILSDQTQGKKIYQTLKEVNYRRLIEGIMIRFSEHECQNLINKMVNESKKRNTDSSDEKYIKESEISCEQPPETWQSIYRLWHSQKNKLTSATHPLCHYTNISIAQV